MTRRQLKAVTRAGKTTRPIHSSTAGCTGVARSAACHTLTTAVSCLKLFCSSSSSVLLSPRDGTTIGWMDVNYKNSELSTRREELRTRGRVGG